MTKKDPEMRHFDKFSEELSQLCEKYSPKIHAGVVAAQLIHLGCHIASNCAPNMHTGMALALKTLSDYFTNVDEEVNEKESESK
jgi:hypothetical protein